MLIGISGKMGAGKNLVCTIIQGLTAAKKHNIENPSFEWIKKYYINSIWEQKAFAGKLKQTASLLTGIPVEKFEDQEFKNTPIGEDWLVHWYIDSVGQKHLTLSAEEAIMADGRDSGQDLLTPRLLLQIIGTECIRDKVHPNAWVNALFADYKAKWVPTGDSVAEEDVSIEKEYPNWIITDMRFPNELEAVKRKGGITIRIERFTSIKNDLVYFKNDADDFPINGIYRIFEVKKDNCTLIDDKTGYSFGAWFEEISKIKEHESETALDSAEFDYTIENNSSIEDLIHTVRLILKREKII